jgi:hypothetical protein
MFIIVLPWAATVTPAALNPSWNFAASVGLAVELAGVENHTIVGVAIGSTSDVVM